MAAQENNSAVAAVSGFFKAIGGFFADFGTAVVKGDAFVKLSLIWMGAGYAKRKQYVKAALMTLLEIAVIVFSVKFAMQYVPKFSTLGTVKMEKVFNMKTMKSEFNDYDNSFTILLFSLFSFVVAAVVWFKNVINAYALQKMEEAGKHINTFKEDLRSLTEEKFHITLLTLPVLGVLIFTFIPILLLIFVAFTNYDQQHMPPTELFSWVGLTLSICLAAVVLHPHSDMHLCGFWDGRLYGLSLQHSQLISAVSCFHCFSTAKKQDCRKCGVLYLL